MNQRDMLQTERLRFSNNANHYAGVENA